MTFISTAIILTSNPTVVGLLTVGSPGKPTDILFDYHRVPADQAFNLPDWLEANLVETGPLLCWRNPLSGWEQAIVPRAHPTVAGLLGTRRVTTLINPPAGLSDLSSREELARACCELWLTWADRQPEPQVRFATNRVRAWLAANSPPPVAEALPVFGQDEAVEGEGTGDGSILPLHPVPANFGSRGLKLCFVSQAPQRADYGKHSSRSACELHAYCQRLRLRNPDGSVHDFTWRGGDLVGSMPFLPKRTRQMTALELWRAADRAVAGLDPKAIASIHIAADLPPCDAIDWHQMARAFVETELLPLGVGVEAVIHDPGRKGRPGNPHVHFQVTARTLDAAGAFVRFQPQLTARSTWTRWRARWEDIRQRHFDAQLLRLVA